jgi:hypothetical protein
MRPTIQCKRHDIVKTPSIMLAEYEHELDKSAELNRKIKQNIDNENQKQKQKFAELKRKYDREGVEFIQDETDMMKDDKENDAAFTRSGARKPG